VAASQQHFYLYSPTVSLSVAISQSDLIFSFIVIFSTAIFSNANHRLSSYCPILIYPFPLQLRAEKKIDKLWGCIHNTKFSP
jgi:hypothetical protein